MRHFELSGSFSVKLKFKWKSHSSSNEISEQYGSTGLYTSSVAIPPMIHKVARIR